MSEVDDEGKLDGGPHLNGVMVKQVPDREAAKQKLLLQQSASASATDQI